MVAASFVFTASLWVFPAFYALAHGSHYEMVKRKLLAGEPSRKDMKVLLPMAMQMPMMPLMRMRV